MRECDLARRLVHYAVGRRVLPKHLDAGLVMLRDPAVPEFGAEQLDALATRFATTTIASLPNGDRFMS